METHQLTTFEASTSRMLLTDKIEGLHRDKTTN
jgi:hypothetical protein